MSGCGQYTSFLLCSCRLNGLRLKEGRGTPSTCETDKESNGVTSHLRRRLLEKTFYMGTEEIG